MSHDKQIAEILARYGEDFAASIWRVQGNAVIYHKALERIAAQARIRFEPPTVLRAERDEAVILVTGSLPAVFHDNKETGEVTLIVPERSEWSIGEAVIGVNYRVSGKQAAYVYAMAEKRAKDRVILKLIDLHGLVYSEDESDDFKAGRPAETGNGTALDYEPREQVMQRAIDTGEAVQTDDGEVRPESAIKRKIDRAKSINAVTDLMLLPETQKAVNALPAPTRDEVRDYAKARLVALGWPIKEATQ